MAGRCEQPESSTVAIVNHRFTDTVIEREILADHRVLEVRGATALDVARAVPEATALLVATTPRFNEESLQSMPGLRAIVRYGVGIDNIDLEAATARRIYVCNVPDYATDEVATHTMALTLMGLRGILDGDQTVRSGRWDIESVQHIRNVTSCVLGVVGLGRIGLAVAAKAHSLGLAVVGHDPYKESEESGVSCLPLPQLLRTADVVTLHLPLSPDTRHLIGADELSLMQDRAVLINTARGGLVDEDALISALDHRVISRAFLDVLEDEPPATASRLVRHPRVLVTPHMAWYSIDARDALRRRAAAQAAEAIAGGVPTHALNGPFRGA